MQYTFTSLLSKEDCNGLLAIATEQKASLEFRKLSLVRSRATSSGNVQEIDADLQTLAGQITISESIIASIPDGEVKVKEKVKLLGLQYRKAVLEQRKNSHGVIAVLETEFDIGCTDNNIAEIDVFLNGITNRLNEL